MKKFYLFAILTVASLAASAQTHVNIIAAPQVNTRFSVRAGADVDISIGHSKFSFVPGLYWSLRNGGYKLDERTEGGESQRVFEIDDKTHWLTLPLRFAFNIKKESEKLQTQILFGPYVAFGLAGTSSIKDPQTGKETKSVDTFDKEGYNNISRIDAGLNVGVNFIIKKHFVVGAFGELGFIPMSDFSHYTVWTIFATPFSINIGAGLNLGYRF